jgi:CO dehydrogenase/acetyl-CoA synthase delta subunit
VSSKSAVKRLENFLDDFDSRIAVGQSGNTAVTVQLGGLKDAIKEDREANEPQTR